MDAIAPLRHDGAGAAAFGRAAIAMTTTTSSHPPPLLLASSSVYRRALLQRLGLPFGVEAPGVDEPALRRRLRLPPDGSAAALARAKADAVASRNPAAVVIGSDQICALGERCLDKPGSRERAIEQLQQLAGREHRLVTAVAVVHRGGAEEFVDVTRLRMRDLDRAAIERYVDAERPFDCAGSYKLEELGIALFDAVESADWTAVVGLPLIALAAALRRLGYSLP